jgi:hypothetical protein
MNFAPAKTSTVGTAADFYNFQPSSSRVDFLSRRMRSGLAASLRYIVDQVGSELEFSKADFDGFIQQAERHPVSPQAFCLYHDLVFALEENDDFQWATRLFSELIHLPFPSGGPVIFDLPDPKTTSAGRRYARFIDADFTANFEIHPPSSVAAANCRAQIKGAFALMDAGDPDLAAEIRALVLEVVLAAGTEDPKLMTFDGASAFMLWGAIMINANRRDGELDMVQMLTHESAHDLLFGFCADGPLVENSPEELFPSPLRVDLRPMEGIYHATFVTARMYRVVKRLIDSGVLPARLKEQALKDLKGNARLFQKGIKVVNQHAKFTAHGAALMQGASEYMAAHG